MLVHITFLATGSKSIYSKLILGRAPRTRRYTNKLSNRSARSSSCSASINLSTMFGLASWVSNPYRAFAKPSPRSVTRKAVMLGPSPSSLPVEGSALAARGPPPSADSRQRRGRPYCDHCRKPGHYKDTCWKIHGKPADWKPTRPTDREFRANSAVTSDNNTAPDPGPFSKDQLDVLHKLLGHRDHSSAAAKPDPSTGLLA